MPNLLAHVLLLLKHAENNEKYFVIAFESVASHLPIMYFSKNEINVSWKNLRAMNVTMQEPKLHYIMGCNELMFKRSTVT